MIISCNDEDRSSGRMIVPLTWHWSEMDSI